ncbi:hypothetical protein ACFQJ7_05395 [Halovenus rubra]|uniref:SipW-cognate class signal peptide n=2 Tax=Halovenus rubra TaxID=869890 RepID=A0ABD5X2W2_9EURY|nr:hypothetical protein [Halovenus rubra]
MKRRTILVAIGGSAAVGSGLAGTSAFSTVEAQRDVTINVAGDSSAYLKFETVSRSRNSKHFASMDGDETIGIDISEHDAFDSKNGVEPGEGTNTSALTWFDDLVQVCNQGLEDVAFFIKKPTDDDFPDGIDAQYQGTSRLMCYVGEATDETVGTNVLDIDPIMGKDSAVELEVGKCITFGLRVYTDGIDATEYDQVFNEKVTLVGDVDEDPSFRPDN